MSKMVFSPSEGPSLGVEIELALVDRETFGLRSAIGDVISRVPRPFAGRIKPELMQCYLEINTEVCATVAEAEADLHEKLLAVEAICDELALRLYWTGTHPFSLWEDQVVTPDERYSKLLELLQDMARQLITFGLHVHVGVDSGDKAVMICDRILRHVPTLLALSANSPWWNNRATGLRSHRSKVMEGLPTAGLPSLMRNWSEYVWLVNHLRETGFINSIRDIWWDVRPHHNFGTVEVRVCDMPGNLEDTMAIVALVHCLVRAVGEEIDGGTYQHDSHPMMVRQNKWRAARFGLDAMLVDSFTFLTKSARQTVRDLVQRLRPTADDLGCPQHLERLLEMVERPGWADRQLAIHEETGDPREVVRQMTSASRLTPLAPTSA